MSTTENPENHENEGAAAATAVMGGDSESFEFVEEPSFEVQYLGECTYEAKITIPAANKQKKTEEMLQELQDEVALPGFRRGKAPRKLIENKFAKALRGDVFQELVSAAIEKLIKDKDLKPYNPPTFEGVDEAVEASDDQDISLSINFEVYPKVEIGDLSGIELERPVMKVTEEYVDEAIEGSRERYATYETVAEEVASDEGDQVIIDFKGEIDGVAFEGGSAENYPYVLGSGYFFPEFEAALKGVKQNQEVSCEVNFPADYSKDDIAGKKAVFTIKINEIKRKTLPTVDDAFAEEQGFESLADLRAQVLEDLQKGADAQAQSILEDRAIAAVVERSTHELPKSLVENMTKEIIEQERKRFAAMRLPVSEWEEKEAEVAENARAAAIRDIKGWTTLFELGVQKEIKVTEEDFAEEADAIQARTGAERAVVETFLSQKEQRSEYADKLYRRKVIKHILAEAKIVDKEVTREKLEELEEGADENA